MGTEGQLRDVERKKNEAHGLEAKRTRPRQTEDTHTHTYTHTHSHALTSVSLREKDRVEFI